MKNVSLILGVLLVGCASTYAPEAPETYEQCHDRVSVEIWCDDFQAANGWDFCADPATVVTPERATHEQRLDAQQFCGGQDRLRCEMDAIEGCLDRCDSSGEYTLFECGEFCRAQDFELRSSCDPFFPR